MKSLCLSEALFIVVCHLLRFLYILYRFTSFVVVLCSLFLLAHLSRRLIGELIVYPWSGVRRRRPQCSNIFFSKTAGRIRAKFYVEPPWVGGTIFCSRHLGHMTKMAATHMVKPFKNLLLQNRRADFHETWYVALGTPAHHSLFK